MSEDSGLVVKVYKVHTLPNTALQLVDAIYKQKDLSRADARDMAAYLDERYGMSDFIEPAQIKESKKGGE